MMNLLAVGAGGCLGAVARSVLSGVMRRRFPAFPESGTLLVNVLGCLAIGFLVVAANEKHLLSEPVRLLSTTGFLGGLTTFSTFGAETVGLWREGDLRLTFLNITANLRLGLAAVWCGRWLGE